VTEVDGVFGAAARHAGMVDIVAVRGELELFTVPRLRDILSGSGPCKAPHLILDLSAVTLVDSIGISTILAGRRLCAARGGRTVLVAHDGTSVSKILRILSVHQVLEVVPTLDAALESLGIKHAATGHDRGDRAG